MEVSAPQNTPSGFPEEELMSTLGLKEGRSYPGEGGQGISVVTPLTLHFSKKLDSFRTVGLSEWTQSNRESVAFLDDCLLRPPAL